MGRKRHEPEEIVAKVRQVDVMTTQGQTVAEAMRAIRRWGDRQNRADRLDPMGVAVIVDEGDHGLTGGRAPPKQNKPTPCAKSH